MEQPNKSQILDQIFKTKRCAYEIAYAVNGARPSQVRKIGFEALGETYYKREELALKEFLVNFYNYLSTSDYGPRIAAKRFNVNT